MDKAMNQVDKVTDMIMTKIMERDGKLEDVEMKADHLQVNSQQFQVIFLKNNVLQPNLIFSSGKHGEIKKKSNAGKHEDEYCCCRSSLPSYSSHYYLFAGF